MKKSLLFPPLKDINFSAFSPFFSKLMLDTDKHQSLYDLAAAISAFLEELQQESEAGRAALSIEALYERSDVLVSWCIELNKLQTRCKADLPKTFDQQRFVEILDQMQTVFSHPLLTSIWLGLEVAKKEANTQAEMEFLELMLVSSHHPNEITEQMQDLLALMKPYVATDGIFEVLVSISTDTSVYQSIMDKFIVVSAPCLYELVLSGHKQLLAAALELYNHYLTFLDNKRLSQVYTDVLTRINEKTNKPYTSDESIYTKQTPVFNAHISTDQCVVDINKAEYATGIVSVNNNNATLSPEITKTLERIKTNLAFVKSFRGHLATIKTQKLESKIQYYLHSRLTSSDKAHGIEVVLIDWKHWMATSYPEKSILIQECVSLIAALIVQVSEVGNM